MHRDGPGSIPELAFVDRTLGPEDHFGLTARYSKSASQDLCLDDENRVVAMTR